VRHRADPQLSVRGDLAEVGVAAERAATPSRRSAGMRSNAASTRNRGSDSVTWYLAVPASRPLRPAAASFGRSAASGPSGSSTAMARLMSR